MGIRFSFMFIIKVPGQSGSPSTRTEDYPEIFGMVEFDATFPDSSPKEPHPVAMLTRPPAKVFPFPRREPLRLVAGGGR